MVAKVVRQLPCGTARHRHLSSGQSGISVADGLDPKRQGEGRRQGDAGGCCLSGHARRHRFSYYHGQWPCGARLGSRRYRGGGGHAGPAVFDAAAGSHWGEALGQAQGGRDRDGSRAHRDANASQARSCRQVRGVFWSRPCQSVHCRPRHHRKHVPRIWCDLRLLPGGRRYAALPHRYRTAEGAYRIGSGLRQGAGHVPHQVNPRSRFHGRAQARA